MRLAAIDIGTNSVHMIVVRVRADFSFEVIDREKEMVRLGAGGLDGKKLTREAMSAALQALSKFERLARSHQVDEILAAATSATREAENGGELLAAIERQTGIRPRIITGTEEARLIHLAAVYGVDTPKPAVVIDIGGGSVEVTLGAGDQVRFARSFKLGVIRLTERFVTSDPLSGRDERKMLEHISTQVDRYLAHIVNAGYDRVIGTSGTILSLGAVATAVESGTAPAEIRNLRVPAKAIRRVRKMVCDLPLEQRLEIPAMDPKPRRPGRRRRGAARRPAPHPRRERHHAVRSGAARGPGPRLHPAQPQAHPPGRRDPRRAPALGARARRALRLGGRALAAGGTPGADASSTV